MTFKQPSQAIIDRLRNELTHNQWDRMKDWNGDEWIKADRKINDYPIGTKFKAIMGGHWIRVVNGFKWCNGSTFPRVGGDWTGEICLPSQLNHLTVIDRDASAR